MARVMITGWRSGLLKVSMSHALRESAGLSLSESEAVTDRVLAGETITIVVDTAERAERLAARLQALGAGAEAT